MSQNSKPKYKFEIKLAGLQFKPIYRKKIETGLNNMISTIIRWQEIEKKTGYVIISELSDVTSNYVSIHTVEVPCGTPWKNVSRELLKGNVKVDTSPIQIEMFAKKADKTRNTHADRLQVMDKAGYRQDSVTGNWFSRTGPELEEYLVRNTTPEDLEMWLIKLARR